MIFTVTSYERSHRQPVLDLIFRSSLAYTHLDWQEVGQWLDARQAIIRLAWQQNRIVGVMATSLSLNNTCWLRVVSVSNAVSPESIMMGLWNDLRTELQREGIRCVAVLVLDDWLLPYLPGMGFSYQEDIITLARTSKPLEAAKSPNVTIRSASLDDLDETAAVDQGAFVAPWQMSLQDIRQAARIAAVYTVATDDRGKILGYQLSTLYHQNGHLARLAVLPEAQGQGIGSILLDDLIQRFARRQIKLITVNTQESNHRSQRLYLRYGFQRNGYDLPVWMTTL